jgi:hypothetical protein
MFSNDKRDLAVALSQMETLARQKTNFNQPEAKEKMREWLENDRRFDSYDPDRLIERVRNCKYRGMSWDTLDDPQLFRGGEPRPLDRWK